MLPGMNIFFEVQPRDLAKKSENRLIFAFVKKAFVGKLHCPVN
jgi:hypothetical protein